MKQITNSKFIKKGLTPLTIWCLMLVTLTLNAQQPAADLDQTRNGPPDAVVNPGNWVNGNVGSQTAHFIEGYSIPYRCVMTDLPTDGTVVSIIFEYDTKHSGKHALDFITHYDNIEPHNPIFGHGAETIDPLIGYPAVPSTPVTTAIPTPPSTNTPAAGEPTNTFAALDAGLELMTLYGGTYSGADPITYVLSEDLTLATASVQFQIDFIPTSETAILAWGGHIGTEDTWGDGNSAVGINGSPYHMRLIDWNLNNLGNQDRSCNADAVYAPAPCDFTGPVTLCADENGIFTLDATDPDWTYLWSITQNGTNATIVGSNTGSSVEVNAGTQAGDFTLSVVVTVVDNGFPLTSLCETEVTVHPAPACSITGDPVICPSSAATYEAPAGLSGYSWSITGDASISGASDGQTVDVTSILACNGSFELTLTTSENGCTSTCSLIVNVVDDTPPVISGVGDAMTIECPNVPAFSQPTATDDCSDVTLTFADVTVDGACDNEYTITRTWTAEDACGNTSTASQSITVEDTTPPTISGVGDDFAIECPNTPVFSEPSAADDCGAVTLAFADVSVDGACANEYMVTRTWTATDACGNTATASQTITVEDNTPPTISGVGGDFAIECPNTPVFSEPTAEDACGAVSLAFADVSVDGACANEYMVTRTWTATDACGNTATASQTITVEDNTPPTISGVGGDFAIECPNTPVFSEPTAEDACGAVSLAFADVSVDGACANEYMVTRTWTATDACGNTATASQTITVEDNTPPTISGVGGDFAIECPNTPVFSEPTAEDACGAVSLAFADVSVDGACANEYMVTRTWTATDACGNTATASQTITVEDNTPPTISGVGGDFAIECPNTPVFSEPTAEDACGAVSLAFADVSVDGACANEYMVTRTWTATDACGNTATASQTITVEDNTPPTISGVGGDFAIECPNTPVFSEPTAEDACGAVSLAFADVSVDGACANEYMVTRTWTATDACGNTATASQTITVEDNTPPTISGVGGDFAIECPNTPVFSEPTAEDACGAVSLAFADVSVDGACANEYMVTRTWTATDACGNTATASQTITVEDNTPPTISGVGGDFAIECPNTPVFSEPTAEDACGAVSLAFADVSVDGACANEYMVTRTWTATDACGNTATASQTITVEDNTPPTISGVGGDFAIECPNTPVFSEPTAEDACGAVSLAFADVSVDGACANEYMVTRTWTATDACGNTATASQTITVEDNTPPTISGVGGDFAIECPNTPVFSEPTAEDACGAVTLAFADVSVDGACANEYMVTRTWTATDACGNTATASQTITVEDNTPPTISGVGGDFAIECPNTPVFSEPTAEDACGTVSLAFADVSVDGACANEYMVTRTWTATDACGNTATASQTITVEDNTPPTISGVGGDFAIECPNTPVFSEPTAEDACGAVSLAFADVSVDGACANEYMVTRTWTATDACGNTATASQTITVEDNTPPTISGVGGDFAIECPNTPVFSEPTAEDACGAVSLAFADVSVDGACANEYMVTRTWTATDACGNTATASQTITVEDNTPPTISGVGGDFAIECPNTPVFSEPTAEDACGAVSLAFADVSVDGACANEYMVTRTWTATDACGNTATASQTITVEDNTPPTFAGVGSDFAVECPNEPVFSSPYATDACGDVTLTYSDERTDGECANDYVITRTWMAVDACGNTAYADQSITVFDNTPPSITGVGDDFAVECPTSPEFSQPSASDLCGEVTLSFSDETLPGDCGNEYNITRTWMAVDACGNTAYASQTVSVEDNTAPEITGVGQNVTISCTEPVQFSTPTITDNCDISVELLFEDVLTQGSCPEEYSIERTWTATDACGNTATASQMVNVVDDEGLTLANVPEDVNAECGDEIVLSYPEAVDPCGNNAVVDFSRSDGGEWGDDFEPGTTTQICFWATDDCGNQSETVCMTVTVGPCGNGYCTLTQGFYGNEGGTHCNGQTTGELIEDLLAYGDLVVGYSGNTMTFTAGNSDCIIDLLPGGGPAKTISGLNTCASYPGIQIFNNNGTIKNILLSQTITLGLNLRLDMDLGDLVMLSDTLVTAPMSDCGSPDGVVVGEYTKYAIPMNVWNELTQNGTVPADINDLYELANKALGGEPVNSSLGSIAAAVDVINVAFDECRIGYFEEYVQTLAQPTSPADGSSDMANLNAAIELTAYPNPFREVATIKFSVPQSTRASLEIYTLTGMKLETVFEGYVEEGIEYTHQYNGNTYMHQQTLIYVVKTSYGTKYGKLQLLK